MELNIVNLTKDYGGRKALDRFSARFQEGLYGILGANGAGKSTLMNLITDNIRRTSGDIFFNGREILDMGGQFRAQAGYMPQQQGFYEQFSGRAFLHYMAQLKEIPKKQAAVQIEELLRMVNLEADAHRKAGGYSGGMKQRLLLAQALLGDPSILILDEPTAGLDPKERIRLRNAVRDMGKNKIVLLATHIVSDVEAVADRILLMDSGRLVKEGTVDELLESIKDKTAEPVTGKLSLEDVYLYYLE